MSTQPHTSGNNSKPNFNSAIIYTDAQLYWRRRFHFIVLQCVSVYSVHQRTTRHWLEWHMSTHILIQWSKCRSALSFYHFVYVATVSHSTSSQVIYVIYLQVFSQLIVLITPERLTYLPTNQYLRFLRLFTKFGLWTSMLLTILTVGSRNQNKVSRPHARYPWGHHPSWQWKKKLGRSPMP